MSTSRRGSTGTRARLRERRAKRVAGGGRMVALAAMPPTVSRPPLLHRGSDESFRNLINGLLTISVRMELIRNHLAQRLGVSGPQYSLLMAIGQLQEDEGISVGRVAKALHVSSAFVATESNRLARLGLVEKRQGIKDRRSVLLRLSPRALDCLIELGPAIRVVNDRVFASLDRTDFARLSDIVERVVKDSRVALHQIAALDSKEQLTKHTLA